MRIAFISTVHDYGLSGADTMWLRAAEQSVFRGDRIHLCVTRLVSAHARIRALLEQGAVLHHRGPPVWKRTRSQRLAARVAKLLHFHLREIAALRAFRPDLAIVSAGGTYDLVLEPELSDWLQKSRIAYRIIANFQHEDPRLTAENYTRASRLFNAADSIIFVSERNATSTRRHLGERLPNAVVLHNPLRAIDAESAGWQPAPPWRIAAVGRLDPVKGLDRLLQSFAAAREVSSAAELHVYGDGPERQRLTKLADQLALGTCVHFHGYEPELTKIWRDNHILLSAATDEGVPMTIPEAMLYGRPVIATPVGAAEEWITDGATGFLSADTTVSALTNVLGAAWKSRTQWQQMGQAAAAAARERYRPDDFLKIIAPPG